MGPSPPRFGLDSTSPLKWMSMTAKDLINATPYAEELKEVAVFRPSVEEFADPMTFVSRPEVKAALTKCGIVKVVPPNEWNPRDETKIHKYLENLSVLHQVFSEQPNAAGAFIFSRVRMDFLPSGRWADAGNSVKEALERSWNAFKRKNRIGAGIQPADLLHQKYWRVRNGQPAYYASDISGTLMRDDLKQWYFPARDERFPCLTNKREDYIDGVSYPYLYFGSPGASFGWHTEDVDFISLNYLHDDDEKSDGPKIWYSISPNQACKLEKLAAKLFPNAFPGCGNPMRHKAFLIDPLVLIDEGITVFTATQRQGEIIITAPLGYHAGFNAGFNIAEARNLATKDWIEYGLAAKRCTCKKKDRMDPVSIEYVEAICSGEDSPILPSYMERKVRGIRIDRPRQEGGDCDAFEPPTKKRKFRR